MGLSQVWLFANKAPFYDGAFYIKKSPARPETVRVSVYGLWFMVYDMAS